jgi:hypothetical protein
MSILHHVTKVQLCIALAIFATKATETDFLFTKAVSQFCSNSTITASFKRYQIYKSVIKESSGSFSYDHQQGGMYSYTSPSKLMILCTDSILYSIDPEKKKGFKFSTISNNPLKYYDLDPMNRFLDFFCDRKATFLGSIDSLSIYEFKNIDGNRVSMGIDRVKKNITLMEFFGPTEELLQQVTFSYEKNPLPEIIVTKTVLGGSIVTDSLVFRYKRNEKRISPEIFTLPEGIEWTESNR